MEKDVAREEPSDVMKLPRVGLTRRRSAAVTVMVGEPIGLLRDHDCARRKVELDFGDAIWALHDTASARHAGRATLPACGTHRTNERRERRRRGERCHKVISKCSCVPGTSRIPPRAARHKYEFIQ